MGNTSINIPSPFTDLFVWILFVYMYITVMLPRFGQGNADIIREKFVIFVGIFIFILITSSINKLGKKDNENFAKIVTESVHYGFAGILGYTIYIDMTIPLIIGSSKTTTQYFLLNMDNIHWDRNKRRVAVSTFIGTSMFLLKLMKLLQNS